MRGRAMKYFRPLYILISVILLTACTFGGGRPGWVDGASREYPASRFLLATGSASAPEDAKSRALANLAKIFEVKIDDISRDESSAWRETAGEGTVQGGSQLTVRYIDAYTTKLLEGANVVEQWFDRESRLHYALATVSREQLSAKLSGEIRQYDHHSQSLVAKSQQTRDPFRSAQYLYQARLAQQQRAALQRDLQIVDTRGHGIRPLWTAAQLERRIDEQLQRMPINTEVLSDSFGKLMRALRGGVSAAGMNYTKDNAEYRLSGTLDVEDKGLVDGWYWYRGALEVTLIRVRDDSIMATHRWPLKAAGQTKTQAAVRLDDQVLDKLTKNLKEALLAYTDQAAR